MRKKSIPLAVTLAAIFGPFGIMYSSVGMGFLMLVVDMVAAFIASSLIGHGMASVGGSLSVLVGLNCLVGWLAARARNRGS